MPGFGTAAPLDEREPILPQLDRFAAAALEWLDTPGAVVCGNSLGGCVALRLAERAELGLAGVVAVAPAGLDMARWFRVIERDPVLRAVLAAPVPIPRPVLHRVVGEVYGRLAFHRPRAIDPRVTRAFTSRFRDRTVTGRLMATGRRLIPELRDPFRLERITCPVLLVWGRHDVMVFQTGAERVIAAAPGTTLHTIEDCGDCPQLEAPDRLAEQLLDFPATPARAA